MILVRFMYISKKRLAVSCICVAGIRSSFLGVYESNILYIALYNYEANQPYHIQDKYHNNVPTYLIF